MLSNLPLRRSGFCPGRRPFVAPGSASVWTITPSGDGEQGYRSEQGL